MHKYILEKEGCFIAGAGFNAEGTLQLQMTTNKDNALAVHYKPSMVQLRRLIKKTIKVKFNIIKV